MKIVVWVMGAILFFSIVVGVVIGTFNWIEGDVLYEDQAYKQLLSIVESKANRVEDFLDNRKADVIFLAESEDVKSLFDEALVKNVGLMAGKIKSIAEKTREEVEEYIREHPDMTIEDLQNDDAFQKIAVQRVGETGYTVIGDYDTMNVLFHEFPDRVGADLSEFEETSPLLWRQILDMVKYGEGFGFYKRTDLFGRVRDKYQHVFMTDANTKDNAKLFVAATTYTDEYGGSVQLARDVDFEFRSFQEKKGYSDLIFINPGGDVIWTAKHHNELGTNLVTGIYNDSFLAEVFDEAKSKLEVGISDSEAYGPDGKLSLFVTAPVMASGDNGREFLGIVVLALGNEVIEELIETDVGLGELGEVYIINRKNLHITALRHDTHEESQSSHGELIKSERVEACFKDYDNYYADLRGERVEEIEKIGAYDNYVGVSVLGAHEYVLEFGWCVIAEMDKDEFLEVAPRLNRAMVINVGVSILFFLIVSLFLDSLFKIKRGNKNEI